MVASIVSMIFSNATASGLAIEPYPIPLASIQSTAPHANYAVPSIITNPYRSVAALAHVSTNPNPKVRKSGAVGKAVLAQDPGFDGAKSCFYKQNK